MSRGPRNRPPLSPIEVWLSDGREVLHFRPTLWDRWGQRLEVTSGELLTAPPMPLMLGGPVSCPGVVPPNGLLQQRAVPGEALPRVALRGRWSPPGVAWLGL